MRKLKYISPFPLFGQGWRLGQRQDYIQVKLTICLLTFLFIMGPIWPALGQEIVKEPVLDSQGEVLSLPKVETDNLDIINPVQGKDEENKEDNLKTTDEKTENIETMSSSMSGGDNSISQKNSSFKKETTLPEADESTGALIYRYNIQVPPGRNNLQPDLILTYNSQDTEEGSIFGYGWSLNIPYIERLNKYGSQQLYTSNTFTSSQAGELIYLGGDSFGPKVEKGEFLNYSFSNNIWLVKDKKGTTYKFGNTAQARQDDPTDANKVYKWMLEEVRDTNDNFIRYEYFKDQGQIYPNRVFYTGNGSTDGIFSVEFVRQFRTDPYTSYRSTFAVNTRYRVNEVQTKISGAWTRKYVLNYTTGSNNYRSLLTSITESGRAEDGSISTLPPVTFNYSQSTPGWQQTTQWSVNISYSNYTRVGLLNHDAYPDLIMNYQYVNGYGNLQGVFTNTNNTRNNWWYTGVPPYPPIIFDRNIVGGCGWSIGYEGGTIVEDLNGDYLADITKAFEYQQNYGYGEWIQVRDAYVNVDGQQWTQAPQWKLGMILQRRCYPNYSGSLADFNGDGLIDITGFISYVSRALQINNGNGFSPPTINWFSQFNQDYIEEAKGRFVDVNRDGLADSLQTYETYNPYMENKKTFLNKGDTGWVEYSNWSLPLMLYMNFDGYLDNGVRFVDINADGLLDLFVLGTTRFGSLTKLVYLNTGNGWQQRNDWNLYNPEGNINAHTRIFDVNSDGLVDIVSLERNIPVYLKTGKIADLLESINYPEGGNSEITYKSSAQYRETPISQNILNPKLPFVVQTVEKIITNDGLGITQTTSYVYEGGEYYYGGPQDRRFAGFGKIIKTDSVGNKTITYYHQGNDTNSALGEFEDHSSKISYPYRIEQRDAAGNLYSVSVTQWERVDLGNNRNFVKKVRQTSLTYDGNQTHRDKATTYTYDNSNGNLLNQTEWGEVAAGLDGSFTDIGVDKLVTAYTYAGGGNKGVIGLPASQIINDQAGVKVSETRNYYDNLSLGSVDKGNLTKTERWISGSTYAAVTRVYNAYGLVTQERDPRNKLTTYSYDSYSLYPSKVIKPLTNITSYWYDYSIGQIQRSIGAHNLIQDKIFDGLDRVIQEKKSDRINPTVPLPFVSYVYEYLPTGLKIKTTRHLDNTNDVETYTYTDGLGRVIQTRQEAESFGQFMVSDIVYNNRGLKEKESLPYFSSGVAKTPATATTDLYTTYVYDALDRAVSVINAVGTVTTFYDDWKKTVTDARGKPKHTYTDAYGRLVRVEEVNGVSTYTTTYEYNGLGLLVKLTDAAGNIRNFTYDGLGNRLTAEDLHAPQDSTFGLWQYNYDVAGNLLSKIDAKGQVINYIYDDLNRVLSEDFIGQAGLEVVYTYDNCTRGYGRLCSVTSADFSKSFSYDGLGSIAREIVNVGGVDYQTDYNYDRQGNQIVITNPDGSQVKNIYNTAGQLEKIQRKESTDVELVDVVINFDYGPHGQVILQQSANGLTTTNIYDATKLYRLVNKLTLASNGLRLQDIAYTYDANGNITRLVDISQTNGSKVVDYTYDDLNRLVTAITTNAANGQNYTQGYTYDAIGNILTGPAGVYSYTGNQGTSYANPHAVTDINGTAYNYDNNGNLLSRGDTVYSWDYNNRLIQAEVPDSMPVPVTVSFYPSIGDGGVLYNSSNSWSITHDSSSGRAVNYTASTLKVGTGLLKGGKYYIERAFLPFDTASLPFEAQIIEAKLKVFVITKKNNDNDGDDWLTLVQTNQSGVTSLVTADYSRAGNITSPVEGIDVSERKDITGVASRQYLTFTLNETGRSWINKTGFTKLGLREGHDVLNRPFVGSANQYNQLEISTGEYSGTSFDPVLEVTYIVPLPNKIMNYAYDSAGQRVKMESGGITTVYSTSFYNTDGTTAQKHIMAGGVVATVTGTGVAAEPHYVTTDHLTGSNVVTTSAGILEELIDYYPFGSIRLDEKAGTFSEQRKFAGHEYDDDTSLIYMNARYYDGVIGRFISQDPLAIEVLQIADNKKFQYLLANPQNWNSYSYTLNNPLIAIDPSGLLTIVVPGTNYDSNTWSENGAAKGFIDSVTKTFNETYKTWVVNESKDWSGNDNDWARRFAAQNIADYIKGYNFADGEQLNIVGHSHGGNIGVLVSNMIDHKIDNLITLGTPVRSDYQPNMDNIGRHINVYSNMDFIQAGGGNQTSLSKIAGRALFGDIGARIGGYLSFGEFGFAGHKFDSADNVGVTIRSFSLNPLRTHSNYWKDSSVWTKVNKLITK